MKKPRLGIISSLADRFDAVQHGQAFPHPTQVGPMAKPFDVAYEEAQAKRFKAFASALERMDMNLSGCTTMGS